MLPPKVSNSWRHKIKKIEETNPPNKNMNSKQPTIRAKGQRSIATTFIFRRSNDLVKEPEIKTTNENSSRISLSDFLNKKLNGCSVLPGSIQGKAQPFSSPVADQLVDKCNKDKTGEKDKREGDISASPSLAVVLEQFKKTEREVNIRLGENENRSVTTDDTNRSRKRKQVNHLGRFWQFLEMMLEQIGEPRQENMPLRRNQGLYIITIPMAGAGGIATWKALITKKLDAMMYGKGWELLILGD